MKETVPSALDVARAVSAVGTNGRRFQSGDVRAEVGVSAQDKVLSARVCNRLRDLEQSSVIEVVSTNRKRYKHYRILDDIRLRERLGPVLVAPAVPTVEEQTPINAANLTHITGNLRALRESVRDFETRIDQLERQIGEHATSCSSSPAV